MAERQESVARILLIAFLVCAVCSAVVATTAVLLKPRQQAAMEDDRNINILRIGGLYEPGIPLAQQMEKITPRVVDLEAGRFTDELTPEQVMDAKRLTKDSSLSIGLGRDDPAKLMRRENYALVYVVEENGELEKLILPVRGYGLWSTLWGFLALEADLDTVAGLGFYQHSETPGLGGEVDNPQWQAQWVGKKIFAGDELAVEVVKGKVDPSSPRAEHQVDGLSGATLTSKGVDNMLQFWLGERGFGKFLNNLKAEGA